MVIQRDMIEAGVYDALCRYIKREEAIHCNNARSQPKQAEVVFM